jgi:hypothetical protein
MKPKSIRGKVTFPLIFATLILLHIVLINATRLFPFTDLPNHLAAATIHKYYGEAGNRFAEFFSIDLFPKPNVFHLLFCGLRLFPSVEFANKVYLSLYAAALPLSLLLLIRRFRGDQWFSLLAFPLLYNYSVSWGFVGFFFALPIVLASFTLMTNFAERGEMKRGVLLAGLLASLFFVHALAALFALLLFLALLSARSKGDLLRFLRGLLPAVPLVLLLAAWWRSEPGGMEALSSLGGYYAGPFVRTLPKRIHLLFLDNYHLFEGNGGVAVATALSLVIVVPSLVTLSRVLGRGEWRKVRSSAPFILFLCTLGCFMLLPHQIPRQAILYQRFSMPVLVSLALLGATAAGARPENDRKDTARKARAALFTAAALLHLVLWTDYFADFNSENAPFGPALFPEDARGTLAGLVLDPAYRGRPAYIHFPSYYTVWRRGIATTKLVDYRFSNVRRKGGAERLPAYMEWVGSTGGYDGRYAGVDLLLVRGEPRGPAALEVAGRELHRSEGAWKLYGRTAAR